MRTPSKKLTPVEELSKAYLIAAFKHSKQFDKGGNPYFEHPLEVSRLCVNQEFQVRAGCILHDIIEDTSETAASLHTKGFSDRVIRMVLAVTKIPGEDYDTYLNRVEKNPDAVCIKLADLKHNSDLSRIEDREIGDKDFERTVKYLKASVRLQKKYTEYVTRGYPNLLFIG